MLGQAYALYSYKMKDFGKRKTILSGNPFSTPVPEGNPPHT